jgi:type II secretory pathway component GspD/PulD (secretin)
MFRSESRETETRHILVFITPTIINPAGNPVHRPEDMPFAREQTPPQPVEP